MVMEFRQNKHTKATISCLIDILYIMYGLFLFTNIQWFQYKERVIVTQPGNYILNDSDQGAIQILRNHIF